MRDDQHGFHHRKMLERHALLGKQLRLTRKKDLIAFLDALQVRVQCLESRDSWDQPKPPEVEGIVIRRRTDEEREAYYVGKIAEMVRTEQELRLVTRERDALKQMLIRFESDYRGVSKVLKANSMHASAKEAIETADYVAETLRRLEAGEFRKP